MQKINRNGISDIVAVSMIILLSVISITLVWNYINLTTLNLSPEISCTKSQINHFFNTQNICYNSQTKDIELTLSRDIKDSSKINLIEFTILYSDNSKDEFYCGQDCHGAKILSNGETKKYFFQVGDVSQKLNIYSLSVDGCLIEQSKIKISC